MIEANSKKQNSFVVRVSSKGRTRLGKLDVIMTILTNLIYCLYKQLFLQE